MFGWRRMFADLGWAMAMADPTCYSYYLASRIDSATRDSMNDIAPTRMVVRSLRYKNRGDRRPYGTRARGVDSLLDSLPGAVCDTPGPSGTRTRQTAEYRRHVQTLPDTSRQGRSISS